MKFLNFLHEDQSSHLGAIKDGQLVDLSELGFPTSLDGLLNAGDSLMNVLKADWENMKPTRSL